MCGTIHRKTKVGNCGSVNSTCDPREYNFCDDDILLSLYLYHIQICNFIT